MKKTVWFVFVAALLVLFPLYVALSGSATLLPFAIIAPIALVAGQISSFLFVGLATSGAAKGSEKSSVYLMSTISLIKSSPMFGSAVQPFLIGLSVMLFIALGSPAVSAALVVGFVSSQLSLGLLDLYVDKFSPVNPFHLCNGETYIRASFIEDTLIKNRKAAPKPKDFT